MENEFSKFESREGKEAYTGSYGFVIRPDQDTIEEAERLAHFLAPHATYIVEKPHITLYHARFTNLPNTEAQRILQRIEGLKGQLLTLKDLQIFGGKFIFWNVVKTDQLQQAHEEVLELSRYLNQEAQARAVEERLSLTEKEMENLKLFGNALTKDLYLPHLTLAYDPNGIILPKGCTMEEYGMQISSVDFAEIGKFGAVKDIIEFDKET